MIIDLDHLNLRTTRLDEMIAWYGDVLDMKPGWRPDFPFGGAWLYAGDRPLVHLVEVEAEPGSDPHDLKLEHGAFRGSDYAGLIARLDKLGAERNVVRVPGAPIVQVNIWDPDGNHLHIDFDVAETDLQADNSADYPTDLSVRPA